MKRLFCLLLAALMIFAVCACSDKEEKKDSKKKETAEQVESQTKEEIATPDNGEKKPEEIGSLPIIFGDDDPDSPGTPTTTTKAPSTSSKAPATSSKPQAPIGGDGTVVETPIIPFN